AGHAWNDRILGRCNPMNTEETRRPFGKTFRTALSASCISIGLLATMSPAHAQADEGAEEAQAIVVTGSRIVRQDYNSNSPIVTVGSELLQQSSTAAIEQNLNKL